LYDHFGSATFFALADTESGEVEMIHNAGHRHRHGKCTPIDHIDTDRTDAVVCQGLGKRALASLRKGSLEVLITSAGTVRGAIAEAREGKLRQLTIDQACGGHRER
jgi:predicted Fe-Mo cluster-binding NifX family protein